MWERFRARLMQPVAVAGAGPAMPVASRPPQVVRRPGPTQLTPQWDGDGDNPPRFFSPPAHERALNDDGRQKVVGESFYQQALTMITGGRRFLGDWDTHLLVKVALRPEPDNPWDHNAVRVEVFLQGRTVKVGYLPAADAEEYQPQLMTLTRDGVVGTCPAQICGGGPDRSYGIYLHLAHADEILTTGPFATENDSSVTFVSRWTTSVTGEMEHQDALRPFASIAGTSTTAVAALHFCTIAKGKYKGEVAIEVRLGGRRVGQLTRAMTERYEALVRDIHVSGRTALCDAWITRTDKGLEVVLGLPAMRRRFAPGR